MTERWQRELSKLRSTQPPGEVWDRAKRGPTGDGLPPRRQRIVAGVVAVAIFLSAGAFAWNAFRPVGGLVGVTRRSAGPIRDATLSVVGGSTGPSATLSFGGTSQSGRRGSYCWNGNGSGICADAVPFGRPTKVIQIPSDTPVVLTGDATTFDLTLSRVKHRDRTDPAAASSTETLHAGDVFRLPRTRTATGVYALDVFGTWPQGDAQFQFGIQLVAPTGPSSPEPSAPSQVARMVCAANGARVQTPVVVAQPDGVHITVVGASRATRFEVHADGWDRSSGIGRALRGRATTEWTSIPPGGVTVTCLSPHAINPPSARFTVVDPNGYWTPQQPTCSGLTAFGRVNVLAPVSTDLGPKEARTVLAPYFHGLLPGDRILQPGYPAQQYKVPFFVVVRDGEVIAKMVVIRTLQLTACAGVGLDVARTPDEALACPPGERVLFSGPSTLLLPGGSAYVRGNVVGVRQTDGIVQVTSRPSGPWDGTWAVIRDGAVIALVDVPGANGTACSGSGIGGSAITPSPLPRS
jgi:hypothetical protein